LVKNTRFFFQLPVEVLGEIVICED